jgi:NADH-ubiquinone oxidoreductase chain 4
LAAILLKLGSYGLWVFFQIPVPLTIINIWLAISLVGASLVRLLCLRLRDLKIIIAYSSVRHMGILIAALRLNNMSGAKGALILILAHGSTSSAIFLVAYILYQANHSRSILLTKGVLGWRASLPLLWFLVLISNIATPPSFNLIAELLLILNLTINRGANIPLIIIIVLVGAAYSLILYRSTSQGSMVSFTVSPPLTALSQLRVFNHLWWRFLIILALDLVVV